MAPKRRSRSAGSGGGSEAGATQVLGADASSEGRTAYGTPRDEKELAQELTRRGGTMSRSWWLGVALVGLVGGSASGGVEVAPEAARRGAFGLRAEIGEGCMGEEAVLVVGPVVTDHEVEACREVVVGAEVHDGGRLVASAGERVVFTNGFRVEAGGRLAAGTDGSWDPSYVVDETPAGERRLFIRWYARFNGAGLDVGDQLTVLRVQGEHEERAWVIYEAATGGGWIWTDVATEDGTRKSTARGWVDGGWHRLDVEWDSGSAVAVSGRVGLLVDGAVVGSVENLALTTVLLEAIELGVVEAEAPGGWIDLDDYATAREGPVGGVE